MRLFAILVVAGCAVEPASEPALKQTEQALCPIFMCGGDNSPLMNGAYFHELSLAGTANTAGFRYVGFVDQLDQPYTLQVSHGRLIGTSGNVQISGQQLVGAKLQVTDGAALYAIRIDAVAEVPYWVDSSAMLEGYLLTYFRWGEPTYAQQLCSDPQPDSRDNLTMFGPLSYYTLVFEGDRIDAPTKTVTEDATGEWFTLGCAGGAPAKLYLTGHAFPATYDGLSTTPDKRQTMLKMFAADYCGTGTPYTVAHQPQTWTDAQGMNALLADASTLDGHWGPNGAECVGTPRASVPDTPAAKAFPDIQSAADITALCKPYRDVPACKDTSLELDGSYLLSANRTP